jgi:protein SERAC1
VIIECTLHKAETDLRVSLQQIGNKTIGVSLFATPHFGEDFAEWKSTLGKIQQCIAPNGNRRSTVFKTDCAFFTVIQMGFENMLTERKTAGKEIHVQCFYEQRPVEGVGIVSCFIFDYLHVV